MTKTIYTKWLAIALMQYGNECLEVKPHPNKPHLLCWVFEDTPQLENDLANIMAHRN